MTLFHQRIKAHPSKSFLFLRMPAIQQQDNETVKKILDINGETKWALFKWEQNKVATVQEGSGDIEELKSHLDDGQVLYGFLRHQLGTDKRNKFVFIKWVGEK
jgi:ketopantoate reductase